MPESATKKPNRMRFAPWGTFVVLDEVDQALYAKRQGICVSNGAVYTLHCHGAPYGTSTLSRYQSPAKYSWGERNRKTLTATRDIQSDCSGAPVYKLPDGATVQAIIVAVNSHIKRQNKHFWEYYATPTYKNMTVSTPVERPAHSEDIDTSFDDVLQWTPEQLASNILQTGSESNMPRLREMILIAEDSGFSVEQSSRLAPWLLNFAKRCRDSSDSQDAAAVWSAIRTGASMLTPDHADSLCQLLQPGHSIETSLVAVKMLGRIFEAQPPTDVDQHTALADEICQIAESLLNQYAITFSQGAAMAHLAIYALATMASSETERMIEIAQGLDAIWFTQRMHRKLAELRDIWTSRSAAVSDKPLALLDRVIEAFGAN